MDEIPAANQDFLKGALLIATPNMSDRRFERSLVLICSHEPSHAMGVIVNKQIDGADFADIAKQLDIVDHQDSTHHGPVFFGGPVGQERGLVVHTLDYRSDETVAVTDDIGLTANKIVLEAIAEARGPSRYLLALGHAGWSPGQLEKEIAMNAWAHISADEGLVFDGAEDDTWQRALEQLGVSAAMLSPEWSAGRAHDAPVH